MSYKNTVKEENSTLSVKENGKRATVYFTRELSAEALLRIYDKAGISLQGKTAIKLHTGEKHGPNIIPRKWVKANGKKAAGREHSRNKHLL